MAESQLAERPIALVTGATSGFGLEVAVPLARQDYGVTLMGGDQRRLEHIAALAQADSAEPTSCRTLRVDLSDLARVRAAAATLRVQRGPLALLVNNAALLAPPQMMTGSMEHELLSTIKHLAHYLFGVRLIPLLLTELGHLIISIRVQQREGMDATPRNPLPYDGRRSYATSKLWRLAFALWLDNRLTTAASGTRSVAAHPGWTRTGLHAGGPFIGGVSIRACLRLMATACLAQAPERGAVPILDAATGPIADAPIYLGPDGFREIRGRRSAPAGIGTAGDGRFQAWVASKSAELTLTDVEE